MTVTAADTRPTADQADFTQAGSVYADLDTAPRVA